MTQRREWKSCGVRDRTATLAIIAVDWLAMAVTSRLAGDIFRVLNPEPILQ
jgi:hypothetical protein